MKKPTLDKLHNALIQIYLTMGPSQHKHLTPLDCPGCDYEWNEALRIARQYTPIDKRYNGDTTQPYLDPKFKL